MTSITPSFDPSRICNSRSRDPSRYTKPELVLLGDRLGFKFKKTDTIDKMCHELSRFHRQRHQTRTCIERCQIPLRPYQRRVVEYMNQHESLFLYHKMGTGKTMTAIVVSQCFLDEHPDRNVVVVSPSLLIDNFKKEMDNRYENIRHRNRYKFYSIEGTARTRTTIRQIRRDLQNSMLIVDEAHRLINDSAMTKVLKDASSLYEKVLLMSGTPLLYFEHYFSDVYPKLLKINPPEIENMLCKVSFYERPKNDPDYPRRKDHIIRIRMSPEYERRYNTFVRTIHYEQTTYVPNRQEIQDENLLPEIFNRVDNPESISKLKSFLTGIRRATQNLDNSDVNNKLDWISKFLQSHQNEKTIVFSSYLKDGIQLIVDKLGGTIRYGEITGKKSMSTRSRMIENYNRGRIKLLFLSSNAREGISLTNTKNVIIFEPQWNTPGVEQMIARAIRFKSHSELPPQQRKVNVYFLYHVKSNEIPSVSQKSLTTLFRNLPSDVTQYVIYPFLSNNNQFIKEFKQYLKTLETRKNNIIRQFQSTSNQQKQEFQQQLKSNRRPVRLDNVSIDYYMYLYTMLKTIKLDYYNYLFQKFSIENNNC